MSPLGWALVFVLCGCVLFAIGYQLDAMEARWEQQNRELAERWEANRRGSAKVVDFHEYLRNKEQAEGPIGQERNHG